MRFESRLVLLLAALVPAFAADCRWDKDTDYPESYAPLIMDLDSWTSVLPSLDGEQRIVSVAEGTTLVVACPQTEIEALQQEVVEASCVGDTVLLIDGQEFAMSDLGCASRPKEDLQKDLGSCGDGGEESAIGFDVVGYSFYELIRVCFDPVQETTLYSTHTIRGASIAAKDVNPDRPSFKVDSGYFTVDVNSCYLQDSQIALMGDILGDSSVIDVSNSLYFARGHMTPDADFVTEQEEDATYYYINAVPQWQAFNNGNWKELEFNCRDLAASLGSDLQIWSGGVGVLALEDTNNNPVDIFLGLTDAENVLPAPEVTWKVVYDPSANEGAAVVGANNPYLTAPPEPLCGSTDLCGQLQWLGVDIGDLGAGGTYCCTVQDLRDAVPSAPDLGNAGLLTG